MEGRVNGFICAELLYANDEKVLGLPVCKNTTPRVFVAWWTMEKDIDTVCTRSWGLEYCQVSAFIYKCIPGLEAECGAGL